jgi:CRP-like cAMP-binding protein
MSIRELPPSESQLLPSCIELFAGTSPETHAQLSNASRLLQLPARHLLFRAGDQIRHAHFLISGAIKRATILAGGAEKVVELVQPQQLFAIGELFSADTYASFAETLSPCVVISIAADTFRELARRDIELSSRLVNMMAKRQCAIEFEVVNHHALTGAQRVLDYLMEMAGDRLGMAGETTVRLEPSKKLIASRIGMAPESFSRTLRLLAESGAIVVDGRTVHIQNAALAAKGSSLGPAPMRFSRKPKTQQRDPAAAVTPAALINLCGKQRMLSQLMATAWAMIGRKLTPSPAKIVLRQSCEKFERNLARLDGLGLDASMAARLASLHEIWPAYRELLLAQPSARMRASKIFEASEQVLAAADQLTYAAELRAGTAAGHRVNIAGRNRMLSARMTKLFLFRDWRVCAEEAQEYMTQSRREFAQNFDELSAGGTHIPEAAAQLHAVSEQWQLFTSAIDTVPARNINKSHARAVLAASEALLRHVDTTVKLFERLAE